ncbi:MAG: D-glucuronyl C5-epimerase family protein [Terriglobales bacterium]
MSVAARLNYYRRVSGAYLLPGRSQLTFWHDLPQVNAGTHIGELGEYYMPFAEKADYAGPFDGEGIPLLNYHGNIGLQHNPIAIAQWGLGNFNLYLRSRDRDEDRRRKSVAAADWLVRHLEPNASGVPVWNHLFDWEYRTVLKAPWYSGLAQGQGISLLVRIGQETGRSDYLDAAARAFISFSKSTGEGGVVFTDERGDIWFEEYIVSPPTHILNGFIWAAWGVYDFFLATRDGAAQQLFNRAVDTLRKNLDSYDLGFWSLYEHSGTRLPMVASPFYHQLHVAQLRLMHRLTGDDVFSRYAECWETYARSRSKRTRAWCYKSAFKLCYY